MINRQYEIKFSVKKDSSIQMHKKAEYTNMITSKCKLVRKICKCSLCDCKQVVVYMTTANQINHNFCMNCVNSRLKTQHNLKQMFISEIKNKAFNEIETLQKDKTLKNLQRIEITARRISNKIIALQKKDFVSL